MQCAAIYPHKSTSELARDLIDFAVTRDRKTNDAVMCLLGDLTVLTVMLESETTHVHDAELFLEGNMDLEEMDPIKSEESSVGTVQGDQDIGLPEERESCTSKGSSLITESRHTAIETCLDLGKLHLQHTSLLNLYKASTCALLIAS